MFRGERGYPHTQSQGISLDLLHQNLYKNLRIAHQTRIADSKLRLGLNQQHALSTKLTLVGDEHKFMKIAFLKSTRTTIYIYNSLGSSSQIVNSLGSSDSMNAIMRMCCLVVFCNKISSHVQIPNFASRWKHPMAENTESDSLPYKAIIENKKPDLDAKARALAVFHSGLWIHFMKKQNKIMDSNTQKPIRCSIDFLIRYFIFFSF